MTQVVYYSASLTRLQLTYSRPPHTAAFGTGKKTTVLKNNGLGVTYNLRKAYFRLENLLQYRGGGLGGMTVIQFWGGANVKKVYKLNEISKVYL